MWHRHILLVFQPKLVPSLLNCMIRHTDIHDSQRPMKKEENSQGSCSHVQDWWWNWRSVRGSESLLCSEYCSHCQKFRFHTQVITFLATCQTNFMLSPTSRYGCFDLTQVLCLHPDVQSLCPVYYDLDAQVLSEKAATISPSKFSIWYSRAPSTQINVPRLILLTVLSKMQPGCRFWQVGQDLIWR